MISDNGTCMLFERYAKIGKIQFSQRMVQFYSVSDLTCAIDGLFFCWP